jgi:predicted RNase H-like HicB family nuclease
MKEIIFIVEQEEDGGFIAEAKVNDKEQIITEGDTIEELKSMIREALELHFENTVDMPKSVRLHFVKEEVFIV